MEAKEMFENFEKIASQKPLQKNNLENSERLASRSSAGTNAKVLCGCLVSYQQDMPEQLREDVTYSTLFAQLYSDLLADKVASPDDWANAYMQAMHNLGWDFFIHNYSTMKVPGGNFSPAQMAIDILREDISAEASESLKKESGRMASNPEGKAGQIFHQKALRGRGAYIQMMSAGSDATIWWTGVNIESGHPKKSLFATEWNGKDVTHLNHTKTMAKLNLKAYENYRDAVKTRVENTGRLSEYMADVV